VNRVSRPGYTVQGGSFNSRGVTIYSRGVLLWDWMGGLGCDGRNEEKRRRERRQREKGFFEFRNIL